MADDARRAFLRELIDDAGLFPPARLSMEDAAAQHRASRDGPFGWLLGRFVCPASRLTELAKAVAGEPSPWRISVILDRASETDWPRTVSSDLTAVERFAEEAAPGASVEFVEVRLPAVVDAELVRGLVHDVGDERRLAAVTPYAEVPPAASLPEAVEAIAAAAGNGVRPGAKLRCGGASADLFPTPARVARFIDACRRSGVAFKATAGLHQPFRHRDPDTGFVRHGFVNLVGAAVLAHAHGLDVEALEEVIADGDPSGFTLTTDSFSWRGLHASPSAVADARARLFVAYGSCSFAEPVDDLTGLGMLPA